MDIIAKLMESDMRFEVRRAVIGDEPVLRSLRLQALTDSPRSFSSTYERELARTTQDWQRWMAPGVTFILVAEGEPRGLTCRIYHLRDGRVSPLPDPDDIKEALAA